MALIWLELAIAADTRHDKAAILLLGDKTSCDELLEQAYIGNFLEHISTFVQKYVHYLPSYGLNFRSPLTPGIMKLPSSSC